MLEEREGVVLWTKVEREWECGPWDSERDAHGRCLITLCSTPWRLPCATMAELREVLMSAVVKEMLTVSLTKIKVTRTGPRASKKMASLARSDWIQTGSTKFG